MQLVKWVNFGVGMRSPGRRQRRYRRANGVVGALITAADTRLGRRRVVGVATAATLRGVERDAAPPLRRGWPAAPQSLRSSRFDSDTMVRRLRWHWSEIERSRPRQARSGRPGPRRLIAIGGRSAEVNSPPPPCRSGKRGAQAKREQATAQDELNARRSPAYQSRVWSRRVRPGWGSPAWSKMGRSARFSTAIVKSSRCHGPVAPNSNARDSRRPSCMVGDRDE